ncbi:uncharacterized protein with PQ loop repeat [Agromyces flavus]|uniref:Uncharacterized conserved protein, contains PQ loop repeat n=1 Tax=Agromyces flavus TaxID=589382 RepID=A0A1H1YDJ4_9MICO|nr:hypothetical protein [Agromyces flavus]MCP2366644.1 uncharacterized protein with PQ loop repeat [Agromyces flavus]GGI45088.1 hypothetical protein GCM10010932_07870 [Agromyces flavus]SDT19066.1 Uncharacterized conserved protein, contains PQ loop repeat [Agromyces flavus]
MDGAILAGALSTGLFAMSYLPMLVKAARTKDLSSYSLGNLVTTNAGNLVYSFYVFSLPAGPIWFLHGFYLVASALMLAWFLRFRPRARAADGTTLDAAHRVSPRPPARHVSRAAARMSVT